MAQQQGSHLVLLGGPGAPSLPAPPGGLSFPADPLAPAGRKSSGGFLQSQGIPWNRGHLEREKRAQLAQENPLAFLLPSVFHCFIH